MDDAGYVRLWRKITDNPVWTDLEPTVLKVMVAFLIKANWKAESWYDGRSQVEIPRGSFITSYSKMAAFCRLTSKKIRSAFAHLEKLHFATYNQGTAEGIDRAQRRAQSRAQHWTMVNVLNYDSYQASLNDEGTAKGRADDASRAQRRATTKEIKNKETNTRASDDAQPSLPSIEEPPFDPPWEIELDITAKAIHSRHPSFRSCDLGIVRQKLRTIAKSTPCKERVAVLRYINAQHEKMCESEDWQKEEGKYVKDLKAWLNPKDKLWKREPRLSGKGPTSQRANGIYIDYREAEQ